MSRMAPLLLGLCALAVTRVATAAGGSPDAAAQPPSPTGLSVHAEGAWARALPVGAEGGEATGGALIAAPELRLDASIGIEIAFGGMLFAGAGDGAPGAFGLALPGLRLRPFAHEDGPLRDLWLAGGGGLAYLTGGLDGGARPAFGVRAGLDLGVGPARLGPFAGLIQIARPSGDRTEDARVALVGLHGAFGAPAVKVAVVPPAPPPPPPEDSDGDAVLGERDRCPDLAGEPADGCPDPRRLERARLASSSSRAPAALASFPAGAPPRAPPAPVMNEPVGFVLNSAEVGASSYGALQRVAARLRADPTGARVTIEGHADDAGEALYNRALSLRRAEAVKRYLVRLGVARDRLSVEGLGASRLLDPGASAASHARNRRVELRAAPAAERPPARGAPPAVATSTRW